MRPVRSLTDIALASVPLRQLAQETLEHWESLGLDAGEDASFVVLAEPGDQLCDLAHVLGQDSEEDLLAEWVADHPAAFEVFVCWSDDGHGVSVLIPKTAQIDHRLQHWCRQHAS